MMTYFKREDDHIAQLKVQIDCHHLGLNKTTEKEEQMIVKHENGRVNISMTEIEAGAAFSLLTLGMSHADDFDWDNKSEYAAARRVCSLWPNITEY